MDQNDRAPAEELKQLREELRSERAFQECFTEIFKEIYQQDFPIDEIAQRIMEPIMSLTGSERGALILHDSQGMTMLAHRCDTPCSRCSLLDLRESFPMDGSLSLSMEENQGTNSYMVNHKQKGKPLEHKLSCPVELWSYLTARSYQDHTLQFELILINGAGGFKEVQLPWMEKMTALCSLVYQRNQMAEDLHQARKAVVEVGKSKAQFLANVSHEIRSPLNGVICMSSLLQDTTLDEEQQELVSIIQFSANNITRIIQDLLDLTQISTGKMHIRKEAISLKELMASLVQNFKSDTKARELEFQYDMDEDLDHFVGDGVRIGQIISNLVNNAIKYTEKGQIFLELRHYEEGLEVVISDTGVGIPEEKMNTIFDQFVQLHGGDKKAKQGGVGLGLAIVKELVDLMGGSIELRSKVLQGSTFTVRIPNQEEPERPRESLDFSRDLNHKKEKLSILIAEDDDINRLYLKTFLSRQGYHVDEAENGALAVNMCRIKRYDIVLMDVSMPQMDGLQATREIRQFAPELPILAVTAHAYEEDQRRVRKSGMNDIVLKPIDEEELKTAISQLISQ